MTNLLIGYNNFRENASRSPVHSPKSLAEDLITSQNGE